jgi:hypothetical protein
MDAKGIERFIKEEMEQDFPLKRYLGSIRRGRADRKEGETDFSKDPLDKAFGVSASDSIESKS